MPAVFQYRTLGTGGYGPQFGFNIIELMVTMAIITIMATVAIPSFMAMSQDNRLAVRYNDFLGTLNLARNEALSRGTRVTICKWGVGDDCNGQEWEDGWIVYVDKNRNKMVDNNERPVIRVYPPLSKNEGRNQITLRGTHTAANQIIFNAQGMLSASGSLTFCDKRGSSHARGLILSRSGQARVAKDSDDNGIRDNNGTDLVCPS
jgi:type IV fimbrial biogenesis protein FimT